MGFASAINEEIGKNAEIRMGFARFRVKNEEKNAKTNKKVYN